MVIALLVLANDPVSYKCRLTFVWVCWEAPLRYDRFCHCVLLLLSNEKNDESQQ
jgi:hypothetical protein